MTAHKERRRYVDIARGIAIICIILGHLGNYSIAKVVYTFHVPIFYFVTGYFLDDRRPMGAFIRNKARTLLVPYAVTCLLMIIIGTVEGAVQGNAGHAFREWLTAALYGAGDAYEQPFHIPAIGAIWFLWATFWGSIFLRMTLNWKPVFRMLTVAALFAAGVLTGKLIWLPLSIQAGACAVFFLYLGWLLRGAEGALRKLPREIKAAALLGAAFVWLWFIQNFWSFLLVHSDVGRGAPDIIGCICGSAVVMFLSWCIDRFSKVLSALLAFAGRYSLLILCIHILELNLFPWRMLISGLGVPEAWQFGTILAGKVISCLLAAWGCTKIPFIMRLFYPGKRNF